MILSVGVKKCFIDMLAQYVIDFDYIEKCHFYSNQLTEKSTHSSEEFVVVM